MRVFKSISGLKAEQCIKSIFSTTCRILPLTWPASYSALVMGTNFREYSSIVVLCVLYTIVFRTDSILRWCLVRGGIKRYQDICNPVRCFHFFFNFEDSRALYTASCILTFSVPKSTDECTGSFYENKCQYIPVLFAGLCLTLKAESLSLFTTFASCSFGVGGHPHASGKSEGRSCHLSQVP